MSILDLWTVQVDPLFSLVTPVHIFFSFFCIYDQSTGSLCTLILTIYNQLINAPYLLIYGGLPPTPRPPATCCPWLLSPGSHSLLFSGDQWKFVSFMYLLIEESQHLNNAYIISKLLMPAYWRMEDNYLW